MSIVSVDELLTSEGLVFDSSHAVVCHCLTVS